MVQVILGNIRVFMGLSLPEPGTGLQLASVGDTEWQAPARKSYSRGRIGGIKTGYLGSLESFIWIRDVVFG